MPEEEKRRRMAACFAVTLAQVKVRQDRVQTIIQELVENRQITTDMAANSILLSWAMGCYLNLDEQRLEKVGQYLSQSDEKWTEEHEAVIFEQKPDRPQQVQQASTAQWNLLKSVANEMTERAGLRSGGSRSGEGQKAEPIPGPAPSPGSGMSDQSKTVYVLIAFAVILGAIALGALRLMRIGKKTSSGHRQLSSKSSKKAEKNEKKLARKRF